MTDRFVCLRCGQVVDAQATVCPRCGTAFSAAAPSPVAGGMPGMLPSYSVGGPATPMRGRSAPSHTLRNVLILITIAAVVLAILFLVPISHPFSDQLTGNDVFPGGHLLYFPGNAPVSLSWSVSGSGGPVEASLWGIPNGEIYSANGSSGSFSFTANGNPYAFEFTTHSSADVSVNLQGTYSTPIL